MKKIFSAFAILTMLVACSEENDNNQKNDVQELEIAKPKTDISFEKGLYEYNLSNLTIKCDKTGEVTCAIDLVIKCTINPKLEICDKTKMPKFIFMEDESLARPTKLSFEIVKIKTIDPNMIEVYTRSDCDGGWFGLCKGNIIYVLSNKSGKWVVKDIYALQSM